MRDLFQLVLKATHLVVKRVQISGLVSIYAALTEPQAIARSLVKVTSFARVMVELLCGEHDIVVSSWCSLSHNDSIH